MVTEPANSIDPAKPRRTACGRALPGDGTGGLRLPDRVFDHSRVWRLEEVAFAAAARLLADHARTHRPDVVVGIARGGVPLARRLGALLGVPMVTVSARHNHSDALYVAATGEVSVPELPAGLRDYSGGRLLVADDICGTGATLATVTARLTADLRPSDLYAVVLCRNAARDRALREAGATAEAPIPANVGTQDGVQDGAGAGSRVGGGRGEPDAWLWDTRDWVVFGWDAATEHPTEPLPYPVTVRTPAGPGAAPDTTKASPAPERNTAQGQGRGVFG